MAFVCFFIQVLHKKSPAQARLSKNLYKEELIAKLWVKYSGINHNHYMVKEPWFFISYFSQNT